MASGLGTLGDGLPDDSWADDVRRDNGTGAAPVVQRDAALVVQRAGGARALAKQTSRERTPPQGRGPLAAGAKVKIVGLATRFELNGGTGVIVEHGADGGGRFSVKLDSTGANVRIKRINLEAVAGFEGFRFT